MHASKHTDLRSILGQTMRMPSNDILHTRGVCVRACRDADRVAGLLEANGIFNVKLLVNRVRPESK